MAFKVKAIAIAGCLLTFALAVFLSRSATTLIAEGIFGEGTGKTVTVAVGYRAAVIIASVYWSAAGLMVLFWVRKLLARKNIFISGLGLLFVAVLLSGLGTLILFPRNAAQLEPWKFERGIIIAFIILLIGRAMKSERASLPKPRR